jgi:Asp-tRNA(Asn)/Glu-tRNA(Gln) amidotransferase A subunit family amidase
MTAPPMIVEGDAVGSAEAVRRGDVSAGELVDVALAAVDAAAAPGAFWAVDGERSRAAARSLDRALARGEEPGVLAGVPLAVKDCFAVAGYSTSGGLGGAHPRDSRSATIVTLLQRAGAIPLGKTAMNPLGWSTDSEPPGWPRCANPRFPDLETGGSSSGSSAAVAAGVVGLGLGTDVAGSVRIPAAYCGIVGFKPPRRSLPRRGMTRIVPTFDLAGLLARSVRDCELTYRTLRDGEPTDRAGGPWKVGRVTETFELADPEIGGPCIAALEAPGDALHVTDVPLAWKPRGFGEVLSFELARTWGDRVERDPEQFTEDIRASVAAGRRQSVDDYARARARVLAASGALTERLAEFDVLATPTVVKPVPAAGRPLTVRDSTAATRPFSALGWPAISLPCGTDSSGRPVALQLTTSPQRTHRLFEIARLIEGSTH